MIVIIPCTLNNSTKPFKSQLLRLINALQIYGVIDMDTYDTVYAQFDDILSLNDIEAEEQ